MKKFLIIFGIFICIFAIGLKVCAETNKFWFNPRHIKTYIPPNNKRTAMMRRAFAEWTRATKGKFVFRYVTSPNTAQVKVFFVDEIPNADREIGLTKFRYTKTNKITHAEVYIAEYTTTGRKLRNNEVYTVMLHEIGHAMGISKHSNDPLSIMYPTENDAQEILKSDIKSLADIYGW